jgi:hypothetical protein
MDRQRVEPGPGQEPVRGRYGGWLVSDIVGPFEGGSGIQGW